MSDTRPIRLRTAIFHHRILFAIYLPSAKSSPRVRSFGVSRPGELKTDERNKATPSVNHHRAAYPPIHPIHSSIYPSVRQPWVVMVGGCCFALSSVAEIPLKMRGKRRLFDSHLGHASANYFTMLPHVTSVPRKGGTSISFLRVPLSRGSLPPPVAFHCEAARALMLLVFSLVRAALTSSPACPRVGGCF